MIVRCRECYSPIFHGTCLCGKKVIRCPDCDGTGRQRTIELIDDDEGYMGYILKPQKISCETCGGIGEVSLVYVRIEG